MVLLSINLIVFIVITARKRSLRRLCFYTCLSVILFTGGGWSGGGLLLGGAWSRGGGCLVETPPGRLLLWAVRILLECIHVYSCVR